MKSLTLKFPFLRVSLSHKKQLKKDKPREKMSIDFFDFITNKNCVCPLATRFYERNTNEVADTLQVC